MWFGASILKILDKEKDGIFKKYISNFSTSLTVWIYSRLIEDFLLYNFVVYKSSIASIARDYCTIYVSTRCDTTRL